MGARKGFGRYFLALTFQPANSQQLIANSSLPWRLRDIPEGPFAERDQLAALVEPLAGRHEDRLAAAAPPRQAAQHASLGLPEEARRHRQRHRAPHAAGLGGKDAGIAERDVEHGRQHAAMDDAGAVEMLGFEHKLEPREILAPLG